MSTDLRILTDRFWAKVDKNGPVQAHTPMLGRCWQWLAASGAGGYGSFRINTKTVLAHRFALELVRGSIPSDVCVLHRCDNRLCVNPDHLFLGTRRDNIADMDAKGRRGVATGKRNGAYPRGDAHWSRLNPERVLRGEKNGRAKLRAQDVDTIRKCYATGLFSQQRLADEFFVSQVRISMIVRNKSWSAEI